MHLLSFSRLFCCVFMLLCFGSGKAQNADVLRSLNSYMEFLNESVHGLTVAHILFVNYNKDLNKYVDLDSHKINTHITNQELGESIFDNPDINTSDSNASAMQLVHTSKKLSSALSPSLAKVLNGYVSDIENILVKINSLRFEIETFIKSSDLNEKENIYSSYELLERAVSYFEQYESLHERLASAVRGNLSFKYKPMEFIFQEVHSASVSMIKDLRKDRVDGLDKYISRILGALSNFEAKDYDFSNDQKLMGKEFARQVREMTGFVSNQMNGAAVPENFKLYGKSYYMHNHLLLSSFNSIGPGFVSKMNQILKYDKSRFLAYDDRPVLYKVTYPQKMEEIEAIVAKKTSLKTKGPKPKENTNDIIIPKEPQQDYIILEFFDPNLLDRDSISVSFNDEWILENYMLKEEPKKIRIDIDPLKGNSVFILAKNTGIIAPNTVGFKYRYNGKGKKNVLKKNLEENSGYELVLTIDGLGGFSDK